MKKIRDRLYKIAEYKGLSMRKFEEVCNLKRGNISNMTEYGTIGSDKLSKIIDAISDINIEWLLTGKGDMFKTKGTPYDISDEISNGFNDKDTEFIAREQVKQIHFPKAIEYLNDLETVSLYDIEAAANLKSLYDNRHENIIGQIAIPNIPKCDGAVYVRGDSMYPRLKSGDIIVFKFVPNEISSIFYGEMYLISMDLDGDDYLTVKYITRSEKGDKWVKLVSHNTYYEAKDVLVSSIRSLALVKVSISMNTMN